VSSGGATVAESEQPPPEGTREMEILGTVVNAAVVAAIGLVLAFYLKGRFEEIRERFDQVDRRFEQVDRRFEQVDRRFDHLEARMDSFQASLDATRSDLTRVALAVGAGRAENA
jgi:septal ring factor EnvC (AmiA/AmiB activator)